MPRTTSAGANLFAVSASSVVARVLAGSAQPLSSTSPTDFRLGEIKFNGTDPGPFRPVDLSDDEMVDVVDIVGVLGSDASLPQRPQLIHFTESGSSVERLVWEGTPQRYPPMRHPTPEPIPHPTPQPTPDAEEPPPDTTPTVDPPIPVSVRLDRDVIISWVYVGSISQNVVGAIDVTDITSSPGKSGIPTFGNLFSEVGFTNSYPAEGIRAVPEPSTWALLALALGVMAPLRRSIRRKRQSSAQTEEGSHDLARARAAWASCEGSTRGN
jgi:hypothetical protein